MCQTNPQILTEGFSVAQKDIILQFATEEHPPSWKFSFTQLKQYLDTNPHFIQFCFTKALKTAYRSFLQTELKAHDLFQNTQEAIRALDEVVKEDLEKYIEQEHSAIPNLIASDQEYLDIYKNLQNLIISSEIPIPHLSPNLFAIVLDSNQMGAMMSKTDSKTFISADLKQLLEKSFGIQQVAGRIRDPEYNRVPANIEKALMLKFKTVQYRMNSKNSLLFYIRSHNPIGAYQKSDAQATEFHTNVGFTTHSAIDGAGTPLIHRISVFHDRTIVLLCDETLQSVMRISGKGGIMYYKYPGTNDKYLVLDGIVQSAFHIPVDDGKYLVVPEMAFAYEVWDGMNEWVDKKNEFDIVGRDTLTPIIYTAKDVLYPTAIKSPEVCPNTARQPNYVVMSDTERAVWQHIHKSRVAVEIDGVDYCVNELPYHELRDAQGNLLRPGIIENMGIIIDTILAVEGMFAINLQKLVNLAAYKSKVIEIQLAFGYDPAEGMGWFKGRAHRTQQYWYNQLIQHLPRAPALDVRKLKDNPDFNVFTASTEELTTMYYCPDGITPKIYVNLFYQFAKRYFYKYRPYHF